jgi:two-component system chemotaxis response regulator CheY
MKILIVDDSKAMRMIIVRTLRQAGYGDHTLVEASSGPEALGKITGGDVPDVILCDWNMPEMTGLDLLKKLKLSHPHTKLGFVTSESSDKFRTTAVQEGAAFFLCKPFTPEGLKAALSPVLG